MLFPLQFIVTPVNDPHDPADRLLIPEGKQEDDIGIPERFVFKGIEKCPFVHVEGRDPVGMPPVDFCRQVDELIYHPAARNFSYFNCHYIVRRLFQQPFRAPG